MPDYMDVVGRSLRRESLDGDVCFDTVVNGQYRFLRTARLCDPAAVFTSTH
eukprot:SAG31_NODE_1177_length_9532_cov_6.655465_3_plen_51_part_00